MKKLIVFIFSVVLLGSCNETSNNKFDKPENKEVINENNFKKSPNNTPKRNPFKKLSIASNYEDLPRKYDGLKEPRVNGNTLLFINESQSGDFAFKDQYSYERKDNGDTIDVINISNGNGYARFFRDNFVYWEWIFRNNLCEEFNLYFSSTDYFYKKVMKYHREIYKWSHLDTSNYRKVKEKKIYKEGHLVKESKWNIVNDGQNGQKYYKTYNVEYVCVNYGGTYSKMVINGPKLDFSLGEKPQHSDSSVRLSNYELGMPVGEFVSYRVKDSNKRINSYKKYNKRPGGIIEKLRQESGPPYSRYKEAFIVPPHYISKQYTKSYNGDGDIESESKSFYNKDGFLTKEESYIYKKVQSKIEKFYKVLPVVYLWDKETAVNFKIPVGTGFESFLIAKNEYKYGKLIKEVKYGLPVQTEFVTSFSSSSAYSIPKIYLERTFKFMEDERTRETNGDSTYLYSEIKNNYFDTTNISLGKKWLEKNQNSRTIEFNLEKGPSNISPSKISYKTIYSNPSFDAYGKNEEEFFKEEGKYERILSESKIFFPNGNIKSHSITKRTFIESDEFIDGKGWKDIKKTTTYLEDGSVKSSN
ncbi:hypothetical protein OA958_00580 [Bacteroidota bacterium]|nr:hypothetical protein [Bacteroidota bacterium]